jgi:histidinol-phosphate phosphatase family protein
MTEVIMTVGFPASGKSTATKKYMRANDSYVILSRDLEGGKVASLLWMTTSAEDCQINALNRMWDRYGKIFLDGEALKEVKTDPNMFPIGVIFKMKKEFEKPTTGEGFSDIEKVKFVRTWSPSLINKAIFLDYDGTLRETNGGYKNKYPIRPSEVTARQNAGKVLNEYMSKGYRLIGVSNQSGIGRGNLTEQDAIDCFEETNRQIGIDIEYSFCPHNIPPIKCYCRKPQSGLAIHYIRKYDLDPSQCIMVGDMTSDKTWATRIGMTFKYPDEFFR